jgi:hypothetical protein
LGRKRICSPCARRVSASSRGAAIGMWAHVIAMLILTLVCSVVLQFLHA